MQETTEEDVILLRLRILFPSPWTPTLMTGPMTGPTTTTTSPSSSRTSRPR